MKPEENHKDFSDLFAGAQAEVLSGRNGLITALRFGLEDGQCYTLEAIGRRFNLSRERIRQIISRALMKILVRGKHQLKKGATQEPAAALLIYVGEQVQPQDERAEERLVEFVENELAYMPTRQALSLAAYFAVQKKAEAEKLARQAGGLLEGLRREQQENRKRNRLTQRLQQLLSFVYWLAPARPLYPEQFSQFHRLREVSIGGEGDGGAFYSDKLAREVQYESRLEFNFLNILERSDDVLFYQEQPFRVPYSRGSQTLTYFPDVLFVLKDGRSVIAEIKPLMFMPLHVNLLKWTGLKEFCRTNGYGLLITDGRYTIQQLQCREVSTGFSSDVLTALVGGSLSWPAYKAIRDRHKANGRDLQALVLKNRLVWQQSPFMLSRGP